MKFIISRDTLYKNLSMINAVVSANSAMPILENFLFSVEDDILTLTASDMDTTMVATIELTNVEGSGSTAVPAKALLETLAHSSEAPIIFEIAENCHSLTFTTGNGKFDSACYPGDEYPQCKPMNDPQSFTIDSGVLQRALSKTLFATGNDELRPTMMGVLCELSSEGITFVATDANKLVKYTNREVTVDEVTSFIIPKKSADFLRNILANFTEDVLVEYNTNSHYIKYTVGNIIMLTSLKEGKYPMYDGAIPKEIPNVLTVSRLDFLHAVSRVRVYGNKATFAVRISLHESGAHITAEDLDYSTKGEDEITGSYAGENMDIGFNAKFLCEMLKNLDGDKITLNVSQPTRAALLLPTEEHSEHETLLMLCMPIMLNN